MDDRKRIAGLIRDHLARERISREAFAHRTRLGKSTVDKLLTGLFSDRTLAIVESHTGLVLREEGPPPAAPAAPAADGPSIAVLPFDHMGPDPSLDYLADGLAEDIITDLSRLRWLLVIARNSSFTYRGRAVDVREVGRDLGVRYVLEGSVRTAPGRMRVTAQLIEAESGKHIWAARYDRDMTDIFAVQDEITRHVVGAIEPHLYAEEGSRAAALPPENLDAWGLVVRAMGLINRVERKQNEQAQELLRQAVAMAPDYARAHALLAWAVYWSAVCYWWGDVQAGYRQAAMHAEEAVTRDPYEPWARMTLGFCFSTQRQHEQALAEARAALSLNPNFALGHAAHGWMLLRSGRIEEALAASALAFRISPRDGFSGFYASVRGLTLLGARRFDEALPLLRDSVAALPEHIGHLNTIISCCGHLGLLEEARAFIAARNRAGPPIHVALLRRHLAGFAHAEVFVEGLVKAGVPE